LERRLARQESDLRGASEDIARSIEVQLRRAGSQVRRLNQSLGPIRFGSIQGIRVRAERVERMGQVLRALREGADLEIGRLLSVGLFFVVPVSATSLIKDWLDCAVLFWLVEGILRTAIFIGYIAIISRLADIRRVFEYHGAEHKTISCYEAGLDLTPENAKRFSRLHPRCGTSFLLIVMIVAIFVFAPLGTPDWYLLFASRILAGVAAMSSIIDRRSGAVRFERLSNLPTG
jgi:uncharacterized protein YqhQ